MMCYNRIALSLSFLCFFNYLYAFEVILENNNNKLFLNAELNVAYFNRLKEEDQEDFVKSNSYDSFLGIGFDSSYLEGVTTSVYFSTLVNNKAYYNKESRYSAFEVDDLYLAISTDQSDFLVGRFESFVKEQTLGVTDQAIISKLDAGYSYFGDKYGDTQREDLSVEKISHGLVHQNTINNFQISFEGDGAKQNLEKRPYDQIIMSKKYSLGGQIKYDSSRFGLAVGYKRVWLEQANENEPLEIKGSLFNSDSFLSSTYLKLGNLYLALSGGYFKNQKIMGIDYWGSSAYLKYSLAKITPYIGYSILYADNIRKSIDQFGYDIYGLGDRVNYVLDQSDLILGMYYDIRPIIIGFEHRNDLRKKNHFQNYLLNSKKQDITAIYLKYVI